MTSSVTFGAPDWNSVPGRLGAAGLDHHDGHVAVVELPPGDDQLERRLVALLVGGMGHPLALGVVGEAHRADRALRTAGRRA